MNYPIYPEDFKNLKIKNRKNNCFLIMRFGKETDNVYKTIIKAAKKCGIECDRSDTLKKSIPFFNKIVSSIVSSQYLIVDISGLNANVFYELGIAHTLRDANNVLILKDNKTECPSDIKHITYFQYDKENLSELYKHVVDFLKNSNYMDNLIELITLLDIIPNGISSSEVREFFETKFGNLYPSIYDILSKNVNLIQPEEIDFILSRLLYFYLHSDKNGTPNLHVLCMRIILQVVSRLSKIYESKSFIDEVFSIESIDNINENAIIELRTELSTLLLYENTSNQLVYKWIKCYFSQSSPAAIDISRYKLQISLIGNNGNNIDNFIFSILREGKDDTLTEHMINICKEKRLLSSVPMASIIINNTKNPYVFRSAMDLITELGTFSEIMNMLSIVNSKTELISNHNFINIHIDKANKQLDNIRPTDY